MARKSGGNPERTARGNALARQAASKRPGMPVWHGPSAGAADGEACESSRRIAIADAQGGGPRCLLVSASASLRSMASRSFLSFSPCVLARSVSRCVRSCCSFSSSCSCMGARWWTADEHEERRAAQQSRRSGGAVAERGLGEWSERKKRPVFFSAPLGFSSALGSWPPGRKAAVISSSPPAR